jgi:hypothetical protein
LSEVVESIVLGGDILASYCTAPSGTLLIPLEQSFYRNEGFLRLGEIVSGAEIEGPPHDWILAALDVSHTVRYAPSLRLATIQSVDVIQAI